MSKKQVLATEKLTMSSREIANLVKSRHDKVKQSIERLVERGVIIRPPLGDEQFNDAMGRPRSEYVYKLPKRDSFVVVAQLSPEFTAKLVDRWQELEIQVNDWNLKRALARVNYHIHTDAVKTHLIPPDISKEKEGYIYINEANVLNKALLGLTAKQWRDRNPTLDGPLREYLTKEQLHVLSVLEAQNALLIKQKIPQHERLFILNQSAIEQMTAIVNKKLLFVE